MLKTSKCSKKYHVRKHQKCLKTPIFTLTVFESTKFFAIQREVLEITKCLKTPTLFENTIY